MGYSIGKKEIGMYCRALAFAEKAEGTIANYRRDVCVFAAYLGGRRVTEKRAAAWKNHLREKGYCPKTINSKLAALNGFLDFWDWRLK